MKKLFSLLVLLMGAKTAWAEDVVWTTVHSAQEFYNAVSTKDSEKEYTANVRLANDINLSELSVSGDYVFDFTFKGKIDGYRGEKQVYCTIRNSTKTLFKELVDASITNLNIVDCSYDGRDTDSGQLADVAANTTLEELAFENIQGTGDANTYDCDYMGVAIGEAGSCTFKGLAFFGCSLICDGSYVGCAAGYAKNCTFNQIVVNGSCNLWADGNVTSGNSGYVGGVCGYADNCSFSFCSNLGLVSSDDDRIGGIVGYGTNGTKITDCNNAGVVKHCTKENYGRLVRQKVSIISMYVGSALVITGALANGIEAVLAGTSDHMAAGFLHQIDRIMYYGFDCGAVGALAIITVAAPQVMMAAGCVCLFVSSFLNAIDTVSKPDEIGGIVGTLDGNACSVQRCVNAGPVECWDCYAGGIVGHMTGSTVENCYNRSFVKGHQGTGGIVGFCENGTVKNNLNVGMASADAGPLGDIVGEVKGTCTRANNYYLSDENNTYDTDIAFTQEKLPSGEIALALNQASGTDIWRQNLGTDFYPIINTTEKPVVKQTTKDYSLVQKVTTATEFYLAAVNPSAMISIENDIDLGNFYFSLASADHPFQGAINGNGHKLSGINHQANPVTGEYENNAALFAFAEEAHFENLTIDEFHITQARRSLDYIKTRTEALLVAHSESCSYSDIKVVNSDILVNADKDGLWYVGGLVAKSTNDTFEDCTVGASCALQGYCGAAVALDGSFVGGMAGTATGSTFTRCMNEATIWADDDRNGGIAGYAENCTIDRCLNTGHITAQEYIGGIVGHAKNTTVTHCVNTGVIDDDESKREKYRSGIVGCLEGSNAIVEYCINYGSINHADEGCSPINNKRVDGAIYGEGNYIYCQFNGAPASDNTDATTQNNMKIGEFALNMTDSEGKHWLYQSIDNNNGFPTNMPVPIAAAGRVYSNILCDGTQSYSNIYQSTAAHTGVADQYGKCTTCGKQIDAVASDIHIADADDLIELAHYVNSGMDFTGKTIYLDNDIDMSGVSYTPIGKSFDTPFRGSFDGQGYRIKNLKVNVTNDCAGLFGCVSGSTAISNLIVDKTCQIIATGYGSAGVVGCMARASEESSDPISLTLECCGNEAAVVGDINAAGLVGGVYNTETNGYATINISKCYNTGNISGNRESAALLAYGNGSIDVIYCYNTGTVTGCDTDHSLIRYSSNYVPYVNRVYNLSSVANDEKATSATIEEFITGKVCTELNGYGIYPEKYRWSQKLNTDATPQLVAEKGTISYSGTMANKWGTIVLPFSVAYDAAAEDATYKFYHLSEADSESLTFAEYETGTIDAGTPMVIKAVGTKNAAGKYEIDIPTAGYTISTTITPQNTENADLPEDWAMQGSYTGLTNVKDIYYISNNQFWWAEAAVTIPSFRAWFTGPAFTSTQGAALRIVESDGSKTSVIGEITADGNVNFYDTPIIYNMQGQRQQAGQKGLQISNGRVVLMK